MSEERIFINGLQIETLIGVYTNERFKRQPLIFDLELKIAIKKAVETDNIQDTLDYFELVRQLTEFVENSRYHLIETLADAAVTLILAQFPIEKIRLVIRKPNAIKSAEYVGVVIEREKIA